MIHGCDPKKAPPDRSSGALLDFSHVFAERAGGRPAPARPRPRLRPSPSAAATRVSAFVEGESVLLLDRKGNRYLVTLRPGGRFVFHRGFVAHDDLIGADEGTRVRSSNRLPLTLLRPRLIDYLLEMPRSTAIVYPKDIGTILLWADVAPGATVLEAGLGSGSLTLALLRAVGAEGRVICYEVRPEFVERALANIRGFEGQPRNLLIREHDIYSGIPDSGLDRILLDVPEPWRVLPHALTALRPGGLLAAYTPSIVQAQQTVAALEAARRFVQVETLETFYRPWHLEGAAVRPVQQMVAHTAFLTFARLVAGPEGG